jgi:hypothetical protein
MQHGERFVDLEAIDSDGEESSDKPSSGDEGPHTFK